MEVKASPSGFLGVFAKKDFEVGDVITEESSPLVTLYPSSDHHHEVASIWKKLSEHKHKGDGGSPGIRESINVPSSVAMGMKGKFKGMILAALCYLTMKKTDKEGDQTKLLELYHPALTGTPKHEEEIVGLSKEALVYLKANIVDPSSLEGQDEILLRVMLIWSCNSFQGGRIYDTISRFNHSCDPNSVVVVQHPDESGQKIVAAIPIAAGDEITISYLNITTLYADRSTRQAELLTTKHFRCQCRRCCSEKDENNYDRAAQFPCPNCHPREGKHLDEDVQYDDEKDVNYVTMGIHCDKCKVEITLAEHKAMNAVHQSVVRKTVEFLQGYDQNSNQGDEEVQQVQQELREQQLQICSSVLGSLHWTTNILMFSHLDHELQELHGEMLQSSPGEPNMDKIAECVDMLQRLYRFVENLELKLSTAHLLADVTIGVARALVSLGDAKSRAYGAEWMAKVDDTHLKHFCSAGMLKVGQALRNAGSSIEEGSPIKKARHA